VQTVALSWQHSGELAAAAAAVGGVAALSSRPRVRAVGAFLREAAVIGVLYGLWQLAGRLSGLSTDDAFRRARWIAGFERDVGLPAEHSAQQLILGHPLIVQVANLYYATMHFTMLFVFLFWLFVRHRTQYRPVRSVLALTTLCCLLVQLVPVAPPRMLPGIVDTAALYDQSVYSNGLAVDQLSAMPSVHVAWAVFIGYYAWRVSPSRWRYLGWAHGVLTVLVVVVTGNHWWLDGIVAVLLLVLCAWLVVGVRRAWLAGVARVRSRGVTAEPLEPALAESAPSAQR
jgi:hypothetical protein